MQRVPVRALGALIGVLLAATACGTESADLEPQIGTGPTTTVTPGPTISTVDPSGELTGLDGTVVAQGFERPTDARSPLGDDRIFVVDQPGVVYVVVDGETLPEPFVDLTDAVSYDNNERGLVTIAFHPRFHENRRFYVFFTDPEGNSQLYEYLASEDDPNRADPDSGRRVIEIEQNQPWHQSGSIAFGPDGYLWLSVGDGGGIGDPNGYGQDPTNLYATILRLDVDAEPYAIPPDNPYVGGETDVYREIWAYGVRNPWRITIDAETGLLYIPDVGQEGFEEVNVVPIDDGGGYNFGWSITEGTSCYYRDEEKKEQAEAGVITCDLTGITMPVFEYGRPGGCAIVGGPVYRGAAIPELHGTYFYGDYCGGWLHSFTTDGATVADEKDWLPVIGRLGNITSIATDGDGELLVATIQGEIYRIVPTRSTS